MLQRNFPEALAVVEKFPDETLIVETTAPVPKAFLKGIIHLLQGDKPKAQIEFEKARIISENLVREAPENAARHAQHGLILAALGRKEEAITEGKRAVELLPESQDAFDGPKVTAALARNLCVDWRNDEAFRLLDHLLQRPKRPRGSHAQTRSSMGSVTQRSSLPSVDRQVRGQPLTPRFS